MSYTNGLDKPTDYFNTVLWTGNGSTQSITGVGFQPDWIWGKNRSDTNSHWVNDVIRGVDIRLVPNATDAEDNPGTDIVTSFDSDGFSLGSNTEGNKSANNYVAWNWLASNTTASNTDGTITSTVSANTTSGFSIVSYTGTGSNATVGHGLGTTPAWVLVKERGASGESWNNFHQSLGAGITIMLNLTNAQQSSSTMWNNTAPTSSVFSVGADAGSNGSSKTYIAYCFAEKQGYSKFGSYTGNGSTDGTFVYTGFKPAWVITKRTDSPSDWVILDNKRNSFNVVDKKLESSNSDADTTQTACDFLSNGIKLKDTTTSYLGTNISGGTYIYMAFAESPLVGTNNTPATAR